MNKKRKIDIVKMSSALTCASTTRNRYVRDNRFFATRLQSWLVVVEDLGETKDESSKQMSLF